jgi:PmbA protein
VAELLNIARRIADDARGAEQVEAYVRWARDTHVRVYEGEVESLSSAESSGIGVRVICEGRQGFACAGSLDDAGATEALAEARDNAGFASEDEHAGLAAPDRVAPARLELWRDGLAAFPTDAKIALAVDLDRRTRAADSRVRQVPAADYRDEAIESAIATSTGIEATSRRTACHLSTEAIAGEGDETQTGWGHSVAREPDGLEPARAAGDAAARAVRMLGATKPKSAQVTIVLDKRVTASLLSILAGSLSGEDVAKGRSLFAGRLGEQVAAAALTLVEDPTNELAYGAACYDAEGLACRRVPLIEAGRLAGFLYNTYAGRLAGAPSTASARRAGFKSTPGVGARALSIVPGALGEEALCRQVGEGLFVQSVSGVHSGVNTISGDFSVGAEGLVIRAGVLAEPVREITIASTIQRMLQHVVGIGSDLEWLPGNACGVTLAISDIAMSGA